MNPRSLSYPARPRMDEPASPPCRGDYQSPAGGPGKAGNYQKTSRCIRVHGKAGTMKFIFKDGTVIEG